jgi:hypothetical protein
VHVLFEKTGVHECELVIYLLQWARFGTICISIAASDLCRVCKDVVTPSEDDSVECILSFSVVSDLQTRQCDTTSHTHSLI